MSQTRSPSSNRAYGLSRVCRVWKVARSSVYEFRARESRGESKTGKRGPEGPCADPKLLEHIQRVLKESPWVGEGHRKVWARLRHEKIVSVA